MASAKYGALITELKGKIGGTVFQQGYAALVAKKLWGYKAREPLGTYPNTRRKRNAMMVVSQSWREQTDAVRSAWDSAAAAFPAYNKFGDVYTPSGYQIWMQFNMWRVMGNADVVTDAPTPPTFPTIDGFVIEYNDPTQLKVLSPAGTFTGFKLVILASAPTSPGATRPRGGFKILGAFEVPDAALMIITDPYIALFGAPVAGQRIILTCYWLQLTTGITSQKFQIQGITNPV